jgi:hypothetical protein
MPQAVIEGLVSRGHPVKIALHAISNISESMRKSEFKDVERHRYQTKVTRVQFFLAPSALPQ